MATMSKLTIRNQRLRELRAEFSARYSGQTLYLRVRHNPKGGRRVFAMDSDFRDVTEPLAATLGYKTNKADGTLTIRGSGFAVSDLFREYFPKINFAKAT